LFLTSPFGSFVFELLLSCSFIATSSAERRAPNPAELLSFRKQFGIDRDSGVAHVFEPANGFVYFFDDCA
jgi:hypothetical protein